MISNGSRPASFPLYISKFALIVVVLVSLGALSFAGYLYALAAERHERLNGTSHWLAAIAFTGAAKAAAQLAWRIAKVRRTWRSVTTYLAEAYSPLP
jgi:ABC-type Fe3+-siderophore transport system permease subunit